MKRRLFLAVCLAMLGITACESEPIKADYIAVPPVSLPVTFAVQSDTKGTLREFPVSNNTLSYRAYVEATRNDRYLLRVMNNSNQRVGLVIAVDGRNIISGKKSDLANIERMYILNPHESGAYEGWRSSNTQTNRFYFTEAANSYAASWGDTSAMGVIAMAVYAERPRPPVVSNTPNDDEDVKAKAETGRGLDFQTRAATPAPAAGTGYGESHYSPTVSVEFEPSSDAMEKVFYKYEWRETLCSKGVIRDCGTHYETPNNNRFWQDQGYAPPPPKH